jgi:uncharacterized protein YjbI with pentapeptide repeats
MTQEELNKIIENHKHWLKKDCDGWENMRADLSYANLSFADLSSANLSFADLRSANLSYANLRYANLSYADLRYANLRLADLRSANLSYADLSYADLSLADLRSANLRSANLSYAKRNEGTAFYYLQCPEEGDFIAFKKASGKIVKLRIPAEARRSSATSRKCRAEFADVLEILNADKTQADVSEVPSNYNCKVIYKVGERVKADSWDDDRWNECSHGIHFFITFDEAAKY